jgi:glycosyltransferase involved in cell wall biosynthesis
MNIAMLGIRGVPANFGGSETAVEEIGSRLVQRGHNVTVYCRKHKDTIISGEKEYLGMRRVILPSINRLNLDLISHSFISLLQMIREKYDVVHFHGVGNALLLPIFKLTGGGAKSLLIVDGPDWKRPKWGKMARVAFRVSFPMAVRWADEIISDNTQVRELFQDKYGRQTHLVGYGADLNKPGSNNILTKLGLEPDKYILQVAAIVPDKGVHLLVKAYEKLDTDLPLIIVGDTPYMTEYKFEVQSTKDPRIKFLGYIYGKEYRELLANCRLYIHPLLVDGTSPALLQAMAYGSCIVASDLPEIDGSLADAGLRFKTGDVDDLRSKIEYIIDRPDLIKLYRAKARQRIIDHFNWDKVTDEYERISLKLVQISKFSAG